MKSKESKRRRNWLSAPVSSGGEKPLIVGGTPPSSHVDSGQKHLTLDTAALRFK
jgi:hypothetical protein